jgi:mannose-6-phosphate isomerase-like protein (cupin superfamily)
MPGRKIRRIVTGHDKSGKAVVVMDGPAPAVRVFPTEAGGRTTTKVWQTDATPARIDAVDDRGLTPSGIAPPPGGSIFRIVEYPPLTRDQLAKMSHADVFAGDHVAPGGNAPKNPFVHRTDTIDYAICMAGEIDMLLDDSTVHMKAGDVMIQQGTNHGWVNTGKEPCVMAFVLIDGKR